MPSHDPLIELPGRKLVRSHGLWKKLPHFEYPIEKLPVTAAAPGNANSLVDITKKKALVTYHYYLTAAA